MPDDERFDEGDATAPSLSALEAAPRRAPRRFGWRSFAMGCAAGLCGLAIFTKVAVGRNVVSTDDAVVASRTVTVVPEVTARVTRVAVRDHQRVERGALLAELDPTSFENALARAKGELHAAEAEVRLAEVRRASVRTQRPMLVVAAHGDHAQAVATRQSLDAEVERAEAQAVLAAATLALAKQESARVLSLRKTGAVSAAEVEQVDAKVAALEAEQASANAQIAAAKMRRTAAGGAERSAGGRASMVEKGTEEAMAEADVALATARVEQARASVAHAESELARTRIVAPMSGVVEHGKLEEGALVGPAAALLTLVSTDDVWVEARIKETDVSRLHEGDRVVVHVDAFGSRDLAAHVEGVGMATLSRFAAIPTEATGAHFVRVTQRVPVLVRFDDKPEGMRAGLNAVVDIRVRP